MKILSQILTAIIGLALFAFGAWFDYLEMKSPPVHTSHIVLFAAIAFIGALSIRPDPIITVIKQLVVIAAPYVPMIGGRRANDPPAPPNPPPPSTFPPGGPQGGPQP